MAKNQNPENEPAKTEAAAAVPVPASAREWIGAQITAAQNEVHRLPGILNDRLLAKKAELSERVEWLKSLLG